MEFKNGKVVNKDEYGARKRDDSFSNDDPDTDISERSVDVYRKSLIFSKLVKIPILIQVNSFYIV